MGKRRGVYRVVVGIHEGKRQFEWLGRRWEDIIKMDHKEVGYGGMVLNDLAQDRERCRAFVNTVMNIRVP